MGIDIVTGERKRGPSKMFVESVEVGLTGLQLDVLAREGDRQGLSRAALIRLAINQVYLDGSEGVR